MLLSTEVILMEDKSDLILLPKETNPLEDSVEEAEVDSVEDSEEEEEDMEETETTPEIQETQQLILVKMTRMPKREPLELSKVKK